MIPTTAVHSEYVYYELVMARPELEAWGQGSTFMELSRTKLAGFTLTVPPLFEQSAIVEFLDAQAAENDAAIAADRRAIDLLKEFRTRLIADVVTGKLDVREVASRLPEEPQADEADLPAEEKISRAEDDFGEEEFEPDLEEVEL